MKERRVAIIVEFCLFLISLLFIVLNYKNDSNVHKNIFIPIAISILSGSFLALFIEFPRYILNSRMMFAFIIGVARRIGNLLCANILNIERNIKNPQGIASPNTYDKLMGDLRNEFFIFSQIDTTLFICKRKKICLKI